MKAALTVSLLLTTLAAASATHAAAPAIAPPGPATLEALLACKPGSNFSAADAIDALQAAGLAKKPAGTFEPEDKPVALSGGTVTGADVNVAEVNEHANTEEPSYVKRIDKRHTPHVIAGDDYEGYWAAVKCQNRQQWGDLHCSQRRWL
ncbi:hypothetical protein EN794_019330 [Mesorhizobium sp. M00.F.Ca.ET.151.01.1.1]|uniref:hypothetical protein n=2 Tax=Pseudomonadota TaxID=1224 RepID=UPI00113A851D|nr:hypothetical protein [Stenotrophomonas pavanii]TGR51749.1 hypothetical protein EN842_13345 [bacterium M00.F.Ca.ET.199.01.1.1]TGT05349.1 hypothetical protein EN820_11890 [bacterium M00.F.Ca.ET.177.01.1.1]TGT62423.1 hypothetical protein EN813_012030 [Mesorhizobium sp. M00.F.Ca.ET.170.01.1.1]TGU14470.1 hypothetical protein EN806_11055 [bacterium M00.F.Ca.ET.163.01.1.1]TGU96374.1 hypothetical protein EN794_019330 [Mesorhizobium sp. M00.F.Ca.ET.151.01.1.1]TGV58456.1 hypothetical protein EN784_1